MATIKKRVKKASNGWPPGCGPGGCMRSAEGMTRREYRQMKRADRQTDREVGDRWWQKAGKSIGLLTQEGIERRQGKKAERRAARGYKTGGKITKAKTGVKIKKAQNGDSSKILKTEYTRPSGRDPRFPGKPVFVKMEMDTSGYSAGAKRFPVKATKSMEGKSDKVENLVTNRKGAESMIRRSKGETSLKNFNLPYKSKSSIKKNPYIKSQKTGGKTSKRK